MRAGSGPGGGYFAPPPGIYRHDVEPRVGRLGANHAIAWPRSGSVRPFPGVARLIRTDHEGVHVYRAGAGFGVPRPSPAAGDDLQRHVNRNWLGLTEGAYMRARGSTAPGGSSSLRRHWVGVIGRALPAVTVSPHEAHCGAAAVVWS
jgi:hypothetical protein